MSREAAALGMVVAPVLDLSYSKFYDLGSLRSLSGCSTWCALAGSGAFSWLPHARRFHQPPIHLADHMLCLWDMTGLMGKLSMEICWLSTPLLCSELVGELDALWIGAATPLQDVLDTYVEIFGGKGIL